MEVVATALSATQTLFSALQCPELKQILSIYGNESKLDDLQHTVSIIKEDLISLSDAEAKQELSNVAQFWIEDLKYVVFEADDLLDEFVTLAERMQHVKVDGTISDKMRLFLSHSNPLVLAFKMSKEVEKISNKLVSFAYNNPFKMKVCPEPIKNRKPETCSYVDVVEIVGREGDLEHIIGKLLDFNVQNDVSFLSIVGMGGLGKTALAQLVYNDKRVKSAFSLRLWHCVSDQDQKQLNIADILRNILTLITDKNHEESSVQIVQSQLQNKLSSKRYLLVLDDVWTENYNHMNDLVRLLKVGQKGSWIVVTTRSDETAKLIGNDSMYKLQGLAKEESWSLFEKVAFSSDQHLELHDDLVQIGRKIAEACGGVPLAIRVAGSLVRGKDKQKWERVQQVGVANMGSSDITPILKFSYDHLQSSLKCCFSYCAIFPKDCIMQKDMLISLWIAHNYIVPLYEGQSIEEAGEDHFLILLNRCFFQDIQKNYVTDEVESIKIHDLLHDIAQCISSKEILAATTISGNLDKKVRHLSISSNTKYEKFPLSNTRIRSYLDTTNYDSHIFNVNNTLVETLVVSCKYLRALKLVRLEDNCLSNSIGKLLHLRYLDLSHNDQLEELPKSLTRLCNLDTLILCHCRNLEELPNDLSRLVKLRVLNFSYCSSIRYMPKGMDKLTCLYRLSDFVVGGEECCSSWTELFDGLEELKALMNLKGDLKLRIGWPENVKNLAQEVQKRKEVYLKDKKHLTYLEILFHRVEDDRRLFYSDETIKLMEYLQPPSSLQFFRVIIYPGKRMPKWISHLQNLVVLTLARCYDLEYLETFGNVEDGSFLPSLQKLELFSLPKLKGWRRGGVLTVAEDSNNSQLHLLLCLPRLKVLVIDNCPELTSMPVCPMLEKLSFKYPNKNLRGIIKTERDDEKSDVFECPKLREVEIYDGLEWLNSLPIESFQSLEYLDIIGDWKVENFREVEKLFRESSSSLRFLKVEECHKLKSIMAGGLEHLSALEVLVISYCRSLTLSEEKEGNDVSGVDMGIITCPSLLPSLHTLKFDSLHMMNLPSWMQFLSALQTLKIYSCTLKAIPNWMPKLTSLKRLEFENCFKSLETRCKEDPKGEDWPYIQHIPNIQFIRSCED